MAYSICTLKQNDLKAMTYLWFWMHASSTSSKRKSNLNMYKFTFKRSFVPEVPQNHVLYNW